MAAEQNRVSADDSALVGAVRNAEGAIASGYNRMKGRLNDGVESSRDIIREDPIKAVLVSAGVGAIVGFLLGRSLNR